MADHEIQGKYYSDEQIKSEGEKKIRKTKIGLRVAGGIVGGLGAFSLIYTFVTDYKPGKNASTIIGLSLMIVAGVVALLLSFLKFNAMKAGVKAIEKSSNKKQEVDPIISKRNDALKKQTIKPDKYIDLEDNLETQIAIESDLAIFRISNDNVTSNVLGPNDIKAIELLVDNEEVFNSINYDRQSGFDINGEKFGKGLKDLGSIFSFSFVGKIAKGAGSAISGIDIGNKKKEHELNETRKIVHKYSFILRLNDLKFPSVVAKDISIELAEELSCTFALIYGDETKRIETVTPKELDAKSLETSEKPLIEAKPEPQQIEEKKVSQIETKQSALDNIELLKKYKELLDEGVISQAEFDEKKKELL